MTTVLRAALLLLLVCGMTFATTSPSFAADEGQKIFDEHCTRCHQPDFFDDKHLTQDTWREVITKMMNLGAEVPEKKQGELLEYLLRTHGPHNAGGTSPASTTEPKGKD